MPDIAQSVGRNARNDDADVTIVQRLLNAVPVAKGGPATILQSDGWCGQRTIAAISRFQSVQLKGFSDGNVQPDHNTIKALNAKATEPGARDVPDPDTDPADQARLDAPQASLWGVAGLTAITSLIAFVDLTGSVAGFDTIVETALDGHFHINSTTAKDTALGLLRTIRTNYTAALIEISGGLHYRSVGRREMHVDFATAPVKENPGYTPFTAPHRICWSQLFHARRGPKPGYEWTGDGFGPKRRAAMVLHEPIHFVDSRANFDVYEFGPDYLTLSAERAQHCAACYPSFGAHIAERSTLPLGPRYGAGRAAD
jgi:hypothetical protein